MMGGDSPSATRRIASMDCAASSYRNLHLLPTFMTGASGGDARSITGGDAWTLTP